MQPASIGFDHFMFPINLQRGEPPSNGCVLVRFMPGHLTLGSFAAAVFKFSSLGCWSPDLMGSGFSIS